MALQIAYPVVVTKDRVPDRPNAFDPLEWDAHGLPK